MKIGFFGDSFCSVNDSHSCPFDTYIKMIENHFDAEIVNLGVGGSSIGDLVIKQLQPFIDNNNVPDICIFCWTDSARLYHRTVRTLNYSSVKSHMNLSRVWRAANDYFTYLWDAEFADLQYAALLSYVDSNILTTLPPSTKIIHMWSFGKMLGNLSNPEKQKEYHYSWKIGKVVSPPLISISLQDTPWNSFISDMSPNHLSTERKNQQVFNLLKSAIDNYDSKNT